jgi:hypothetical protein
MRRASILSVIIGLAFAPALFSLTYPCPAAGSGPGGMVTLHNAATTAAAGTVLEMGNCPAKVTIYITWSACSANCAGAVILETADTASYAGTWAALTPAISITASKQDVLNITQPFKNLRVRISTTVSGTAATVTVKAQGSRP